MKICTSWQECKHMSCYHITGHNPTNNCREHECVVNGVFTNGNCVEANIEPPVVEDKLDRIIWLLERQNSELESIRMKLKGGVYG